jgi:hypothetical protein
VKLCVIGRKLWGAPFKSQSNQHELSVGLLIAAWDAEGASADSGLARSVDLENLRPLRAARSRPDRLAGARPWRGALVFAEIGMGQRRGHLAADLVNLRHAGEAETRFSPFPRLPGWK